MRPADLLFLAGLALGGAWIWLRDPGARVAPEDTMPLLAALPLMAWLGSPWRVEPGPFRLHAVPLAVAGVAVAAGLVSGLDGLLALGWTALLWAWLQPRLPEGHRARVWRLLPLALLAFPWITRDLPALAWWYRLSAAWSAEHCLSGIGLEVRREGTQIFVHQLPFDVAPACSGIQGLQALLVAGTALCFLQVGTRPFYWPAVGLLPLVAWLANALRVMLLIAAGLSFGPEVVTGWFHTVGGWLVLVMMFGLTWLALELLRRLQPRPLSA